jgi:hypothetical protein
LSKKRFREEREPREAGKRMAELSLRVIVLASVAISGPLVGTIVIKGFVRVRADKWINHLW